MLNTKLILIDGIIGSGKSTTAHFIARQLEKNGIKTTWLHEGSIINPIICSDKDIEDAAIDTDDDETFGNWLVEFYIKKWSELAKEIAQQDTIYIMESYLFQNILRPVLYSDRPDSEIKELVVKLFNSISQLKPVIIHLYQNDPVMAVKRICNQRGKAWTNDILSGLENSKFATNRNLKGNDAAFVYWHKISDLALDLFDELNCEKLTIENTEQNWDFYRKQITDFLGVRKVAEPISNRGYYRFCGNFYGRGEYLKVHVNDGKLLLDTFWKNMRMLENSEYEFEIEGFPTSYEFLPDKNGDVNSLRIVKAGHECDHELTGSILNRLEDYSDPELLSFCGSYHCDSENLSRKIYKKNGCLYYSRSTDSETLLIPLSRSELAMYITDSTLQFDFTGDGKRFILKSNGKEDALFVQSD